jgi:hypothetical protein
MSRAHPIGLRIASKKLNPPFIGVSQYYSYNQLKCNIVISKSIKQLSKQLAVPAYQIVDRNYSEKNNTKNLVLYPNLLPMSVRLKAKQLFDSQCVLNRRRLYSVAIYITRLLKQLFEKNYNNFIEKTCSKPFSNVGKNKRKPSGLNLPLTSLSKYQKWKSTKLKFCSKCPSITFARAFFRVSKKPFLNPYDTKRKLSTKNQKIYKKEKKATLLEQTKQSESLPFLLPTKNSDPYLMLSYGVPSSGLLLFNYPVFGKATRQLKDFYFVTKKTSVSIYGSNLNYPTPVVKNNCNLSARVSLPKQAFALNCCEPLPKSKGNGKTPVFTLKKLKSKNSGTSFVFMFSQAVSKTNYPELTLKTLRLGVRLGKNENLNVGSLGLDQGVANIKKRKVTPTNNLTNYKQPFYSFFFQYLTYIKQYGTNTFTACPEWPLSVCFSPASWTCSINITNRQKRLTAIVVNTRVNSTKKATKQEKHVYLKTKKKDPLPSKKLRVSSLTFEFESGKKPLIASVGIGIGIPLLKDDSAIAFSKNQRQDWVQLARKLYSKPTISYQNIKRFILLNYLSQLSPFCALYQKELPKGVFKTNHISKPTVNTSLALAKEVRNRQKRLYLNSVPINKEEILFLSTQHAHKISYTFCPRSQFSVTILNLKNIKKLTKQIEHFRSDIKLLAPLGLLLHRSFLEPVGINCISAMDNRLGKTYCDQFLKNLLFRRTSNNFLKSNYMNSQIGLLRAKNTILFDFAYTKDSLIKLGLKKTNTLMQQLLETGHTTLWLRKFSSIRL